MEFQTSRFIPGLILVLLALASAGFAVAEPPGPVHDPRKYPEGLPKYLTPEERDLPLPSPALEVLEDRAAPTGAVYCPAEYEPQEGLFLAWEGYTSILTEMAVNITTLDPDAIVYVVVDSTSERSSASTTLTGAGADLSQVEFVVRGTDTVWIRDYGPRFIYEDGTRSIIDHTYNRPRPNDNALNDYISAAWETPQYDIPLTHGGGNFHLFANGDAFMTDLILDENPGMTEQDVSTLYNDYQNLDLTIYPGFPTSFDSTQHIDMWMLPVADDAVIIGQYSSSTGSPYSITENATAELSARGYTVYRTPGWNSGGTHYTYTNAVILNDLVFMPKFNVSQDATALAVFESALPDKTIIQIDCSSIIHAAGALHCIAMHVPAYAFGPDPTVTVLEPNGGESLGVGQSVEITWSAHDDVAVTGVDLYLSTDGGASWPHVIAISEVDDGAYTWTVPYAVTDSARIKVVANDGDGLTGEDVSDDDFAIVRLPQPVYAASLDADPGWSTTGDWAFGQPGGGGTHEGDPASGATGSYVYGYNLAGDYPRGMTQTEYLTTTAFDCSQFSGVQLHFRRWLGVEKQPFDYATVEVSNDGIQWYTVWSNGAENISDSAWTLQSLDIGAVADGAETLFVRWGMGPTDYGVQYPGWNIDDIEIHGVPPVGDGDFDSDGDVDLRDFSAFQRCSAGIGSVLPPVCHPGDLDADADVDLDDFTAFESRLISE